MDVLTQARTACGLLLGNSGSIGLAVSEKAHEKNTVTHLNNVMA